MKKGTHEYKKPEPVYIKYGGLPILPVGIIIVITVLFLLLFSKQIGEKMKTSPPLNIHFIYLLPQSNKNVLM
ncbi:hypothetical protein HEMROJRC1_20560 [Rodentibacter sp. JRC1]|uniref:hypothetical protein n=1 Tax=Rodentibacter sp. JRC1 TaxID=2874504 RepID=UPI001CFDCD4F|nr:hypothetical protein [Rodentibacter sp. JRC1]GJI56944.1 hypothetical protein HEMROJRC1_20560 [Rodentibacter sp. JRC1]